jgi:hypothetical protein
VGLIRDRDEALRLTDGAKTMSIPRGGREMAVNRFCFNSALTRSAAVALTVITVALIWSPQLAAREQGRDDSSSSIDDVSKKQNKQKKEKPEGEEKRGPKFIPVPIFITEPAVGYGLGGALGYFHPKKGQDQEKKRLAPGLTATAVKETGKRQKTPPTISGIAVAYTENGSWGGGLGHSASWKKDRIRYKGAIGYVNLVSEFWFFDRPFEFNFAGGLLYQDIMFRMGNSKIWLGGRLAYVNSDLEFVVEPPSEPVPDRSFGRNVQDFGLALQSMYEGRDNKMTPNSGQFVELVAYKHFENSIGDFDYSKVMFKVLSFHQFADDKLVLGLRLDLKAAGGDPPLWGYPFITLRGVPALRYQNEQTGVVEAELRWNMFERWAVVGFFGGGGTRGDTRLYVDAKGIYAGGIGGRYLFRPQDSLWVGADLARGPEDYAFYIQVGHAW